MFPIENKTIEEAAAAVIRPRPVEEIGRSIKFDYDKREENGGYWRAEKNSSPIYDIQEETVIPTLQWVSLDGETQHSDLTNTGYIGSVLQSGTFDKYCQIDERKKAYKRYIIKAAGLPYFYEEDEEEQQ